MDNLREEGVIIKSGNAPLIVFLITVIISFDHCESLLSETEESACLRHMTEPASALPPLGSCEERFSLEAWQLLPWRRKLFLATHVWHSGIWGREHE